MTAISFPTWREVPATAWRWPHFQPRELACKGDGSLVVVPPFLDRLEALRAAVARPLVIMSGYRSPAYNARVSTTGADGPHTTGQAVDIAIRGPDALALIAAAIGLGFTGVGVRQHGDGRFIHIDDLDPSMNRPRPTIWSYPAGSR